MALDLYLVVAAMFQWMQGTSASAELKPDAGNQGGAARAGSGTAPLYPNPSPGATPEMLTSTTGGQSRNILSGSSGSIYTQISQGRIAFALCITRQPYLWGGTL